MAGMRPIDPYYDPETDPEYAAASERLAMREGAWPRAAPLPELPGMDSTPPEPARSKYHPAEMLQDWMAAPRERPNRRIQGPTLDLSVIDQAPQRPVGKPMPMSKPSTRGPMVSAPAKAGASRGPKTQLALHFARALGQESDAPVDSPEELAFTKAAHAAMLKMSKGKSVAQFLSSANSAKAANTFKQLLDAEMAKSKTPHHAGTGASP